MALRRQLTNEVYRQLDTLVMEGKAQLIATPTITSATTPTIVAPPAGQVAIITKVVGTAYPNKETSPGFGDANELYSGMIVYDENGDLTAEGAEWLGYWRNDLLFEGAQTPSWRSAVPCAPVVWEPEQPLIIPPMHTLRANMSGNMAGGCFACYGYIVDQDSARHLGFDTNTQDFTYDTNKKNRSGFRGVGLTTGSPYINLITAQTGYTIQVIDINVRIQSTVHAPTKRTVLFQGTTIIDQTTASNVIMKFTANNPSDPLEWTFSPGIYLDANQGLWYSRAADDLLSENGVGSTINVTYRYVKNSDVPKDHFWSFMAPTLAGSTAATAGTSSLYATASTVATVRYPGIAGDPVLAAASVASTATAPGVGKQFVVEGYCISAQKDLTVLADQSFMAITTGTASGNIGIASSGLTTTNKLISPIIALSSHDQSFALAVDGINIPCIKDTGRIQVDMTTVSASGSATPAASDADLDELAVLVWGRTSQARFGTGHFQGAAS